MQIWNELTDLISSSPPNVHYFCLAESGERADRSHDPTGPFDQEILTLSEDEQEYWRARFHFVTESIWTAGPVGELSADGRTGLWESTELSDLSEVGMMQFPTNTGSVGMMETLVFEAQHYNYLIDRQTR